MKRFGLGIMTLVFAVSLLAVSARAQDKFTQGMTGGT